MTDLQHPSNWKYESPESEGYHRIIDPENSACKVTWIFRLNLREGSAFSLSDPKLELNGVVIMGKLEIVRGNDSFELNKLDSFFLPGGEVLELRAREDCFLFIGGSLCNGRGVFLTRKYDLSLPLGEIHQVHGKPPYRREVFMTIAQQDKASRLICGITCGDPCQEFFLWR